MDLALARLLHVHPVDEIEQAPVVALGRDHDQRIGPIVGDDPRARAAAEDAAAGRAGLRANASAVGDAAADR